MDLSVQAETEQLSVDPSRVRVLLRNGDVPGRRSGGVWMVDGVQSE
jgi:hypothetical protein